MKKTLIMLAALTCFNISQNCMAHEIMDSSGCLASGCHTADQLHGITTHTTCSNCHATAAGGGSVAASKCIVCHPTGDAGQCNLIKVSTHEAANCLSCHSECESNCPSATVLGARDAQLYKLRDFRDKVLAKSAFGKKIVAVYYAKADSINEVLAANPRLRAFSKKALQSFIPVLDIFM